MATLNVDQAIEVITIVGVCWICLRAINEVLVGILRRVRAHRVSEPLDPIDVCLPGTVGIAAGPGAVDGQEDPYGKRVMRGFRAISCSAGSTFSPS